MINMDMIGRVSKNKYVSGTGTSPGFQKLVQDANHVQNFDISFSSSGYGASDHTSFTVKEIPVLFFFLRTSFRLPQSHRTPRTRSMLWMGLAWSNWLPMLFKDSTR